MCSTPSVPSNNQEPLATPTYADASVSKASANARSKATSLGKRNIATTSRGLLDDAETNKKGLLGE